MLNKSVLKINKLQKIVVDKGVKLSTLLLRDGEEFECFFEYPLEYIDYICDERCDAFVVALLPYAMNHGLNIECDGILSEKLLYQINNYYIPVLSKFQEQFSYITVSVKGVNHENLCTGNGCGAAISCGVDSFYTLLKHTECDIPRNYQLTHLVSMNVGAFGYQGGDFSYNWFQEQLKKAKVVADELKKPLIAINSNLMEFYQRNHTYSGTFRMVGAILGLQKLFSNYYLSAGFALDGFDISSEENDDYDLFNLLIGSNESVTFYSSGMDTSRYERTKYITKFSSTFNNLTVCEGGNNNCGECEKCLRTMITLDCIGKLDKYNQSFDINKFKNNKFYNLLKIRAYAIGYLKPLYQEILKNLKENGRINYYILTFLAFAIIKPGMYLKHFFRAVLKRKNNLIKKS